MEHCGRVDPYGHPGKRRYDGNGIHGYGDDHVLAPAAAVLEAGSLELRRGHPGHRAPPGRGGHYQSLSGDILLTEIEGQRIK